ncbi:MAG TPA: polysaccharide biosynthesis/export family protein, partial [Xanthobacteraceae bacterium]|nr:polysaccharide biosynthesis/export family protein [Xanthobacteraceae bacterium]
GRASRRMARRFGYGILGLLVAAVLAGCSALPASGPLATQVESQESPSGVLGGYVLIDMDERVASISASQPRESFKRVFSTGRPAPDLRIGVSDSVVVTIWEAAAGGLFSASPMDRTLSAGSRTATIPEQVVARDGTIEVPYAGRLRVAGMTPAEVEREIVNALAHKAIEPQVVVTISRNFSNAISVGGEVTTGARVPLTTKGDRILDVIASAGGIRIPASDAFIHLTRGQRTVSVAYNTILAHPEENVYAMPGDDITVVHDPQTFTAFGSTGRNAQVPFDAAGITLEEAIAKAGGLLDDRADPAGIFLLRFEPTALVQQLMPNRDLPSRGDLVPVVYRLNLRDANSFFLARSFAMEDKDMLYVANSASDPVQKFLGLVGTVVTPVYTGTVIYGATR